MRSRDIRAAGPAHSRSLAAPRKPCRRGSHHLVIIIRPRNICAAVAKRHAPALHSTAKPAQRVLRDISCQAGASADDPSPQEPSDPDDIEAPWRQDNHVRPGEGQQGPPGAGAGGDDVPYGASPLTLGSEVRERMAKLVALDQYRALIAQLAAAAAAASSSTSRKGITGIKSISSSSSSSAAAAAAAGGEEPPAAAAAAGDDDDSSMLLRGALLIARHRYPSLDERKVYDTLDDMARRVSALLPADPRQRYPLRVVAAINRVMYQDYGFRGNEEDYYNSDNSYINRVMDRRVGIPISLSLVYSEVARRVGLPMRGLNLPGHFMLQPLRRARRDGGSSSSGSSSSGGSSSSSSSRTAEAGGGGAASAADGEGQAGAKGGVEEAGRGGEEDEEGEDEEEAPLEVLVDAFRSGEVCLAAEAEERLSQVLGSPVRIDPRVLRESEPLPPRMFLLRMLSNLRSIYLSTQQVELLLDVLKYMKVTLQDPQHPEAEADEDEAAASPASPPPEPSAASGAFSPVAIAALARDEGLCYFALRRYPECVESLREYVTMASGAGPLPPEEAHTVSAVMTEALKRMTSPQRQ